MDSLTETMLEKNDYAQHTRDRASTRGRSVARSSVFGGGYEDMLMPGDDEKEVEAAIRETFGAGTYRYSSVNAPSTGGGFVDRNRNAIATSLVLASSLIASLMSLDVAILNGSGSYKVKFTTQTWIAGVVGMIVSYGLILNRRDPWLKDPTKLWDIQNRGLCGGVTVLCAFYAVTHLSLATANTLMFTMPLWTGVLGVCMLGKYWDKFQVVVAVSCLGGVILIAQPWDIQEVDINDDYFPEIVATGLGYVAALAFAILNAYAAISVNTSLREESPVVMTFWQMFYAVVIGVACELAFEIDGKGYTGLSYMKGGDQEPLTWEAWCLIFCVGIAMVSQQGLRNMGLALSTDSAVVVALYFEVVLSFVWDIVILHNESNAFMFCGAALIVIGSSGSAIIKNILLNSKAANAEDETRISMSMNLN